MYLTPFENTLQGIMAGINAALLVQNKSSFILDRAVRHSSGGISGGDVIVKGLVAVSSVAIVEGLVTL